MSCDGWYVAGTAILLLSVAMIVVSCVVELLADNKKAKNINAEDRLCIWHKVRGGGLIGIVIGLGVLRFFCSGKTGITRSIAEGNYNAFLTAPFIIGNLLILIAVILWLPVRGRQSDDMDIRQRRKKLIAILLSVVGLAIAMLSYF